MDGPVFPEPIETERLRLETADAATLEAWAERDEDLLEERTGARFPAGALAPPLFDEDLAFLRDRIRDDPDGFGWLWIAIDRREETPVGVVGVAPTAPNVLTIGYSVYPDHQGRGYATEAVGAVLAWTFARPGVRAVRATIPAWNAPSIRVAEKSGMHRTGTAIDPEVGEVLVFEILPTD